jgi:Na+-translocating ferredoxin:NAD+ oxidoreductase RnfD subunit
MPASDRSAAPPVRALSPNRSWTIRGPQISDPRLHVALLLLTVQLLGQIAIRWELSVAQILVSLGTSAIFEVVVGWFRDRTIAWPASGMLTGNGVALLLRVPGTVPGDWWSLNGWYLYAGTVLISLLLKYAIRYNQRPIFNPSNLGLVLVFLVLGSDVVNPQDLWWGPASLGLIAAYLVIVAGGASLLARLNLWRIALSFIGAFAIGAACLAAAGHAITARWHLGEISGVSLWTLLVLSPEILIFAIFMITDPRTIPAEPRHHALFGATVGLVDVVLVATQVTEFGAKVAILGGLLITCAAVPMVSRYGLPAAFRRTSAGLAMAAVVLVASFAISRVVVRGNPLIAVASSAYQGAVPEVRLSEDLDYLADAPDRDEARQVVLQTLGSLALESRALAEGKPTALRQAVGGPRLADSEALLANYGTFAREYRVDVATVTVFRTQSGPQARPTLAVRAQGTVDQESGPSPGTQKLDALFVLASADGRWVVVDEKS